MPESREIGENEPEACAGGAPPEEPEAGPDTADQGEENGPDPAELEAQRDAALGECEQLRDRLMRSQADFENIRKRLEREKREVVRFAAAETIEALLPIADDFERAIGADGVSKEIREGLELIHRRMFEVFRRAGLEEVEQHETFDPSVHCAVDRAPAGEGQADLQILDVYMKGYLFKGRLLRASMVKVAVQG